MDRFKISFTFDLNFLDDIVYPSIIEKTNNHVILLNMPPPIYCDVLVRTSNTFICADGGSNRLYDAFSSRFDDILPSHLCGDLDSIRPEVMKYYESKGVAVVQDPDQDTNDLEKCIKLLSSLYKNDVSKTGRLLILGGTGGRFDQTIANIRLLFTLGSYFPPKEIDDSDPFSPIPYILGEESILFLLKPGLNKILTPSSKVMGKYCGLLPVGQSARSVTTQGLKWDVSAATIEMSGLVSSSNACNPDSVIMIESSDPLVFFLSTADIMSMNDKQSILGDPFKAFSHSNAYGLEECLIRQHHFSLEGNSNIFEEKIQQRRRIEFHEDNKHGGERQ